MYMSYCRFEGTRQELGACLNTVDEHAEGCAEYEVSDGEVIHFRKMVEEFHAFLTAYELIDENGDLDEYELEKLCVILHRANTNE